MENETLNGVLSSPDILYGVISYDDSLIIQATLSHSNSPELFGVLSNTED